MATYSRINPEGWSQGVDTSDASRVTPVGWEQIKGVSAGGSQIKSLNGLAIASVKSRNGLAIASIKSINGLTNV